MQPWIRQTLKTWREAAGLSMADVAHHMRAADPTRKTSASVIAKCENGVQHVPDYVVEGYADALDVPAIMLWKDALNRWDAALGNAGKRGEARAKRLRAAARRGSA